MPNQLGNKTMGKRTEKALSAMVLQNAISAGVTLESVVVDAETGKPESALIVTAWKGVLPPETGARYQCGKDGVFGAAAGTVAAALGALLDALKIHKDAYAVPTKVGFAVASDNAPKEPENFDELDDVAKAAMVADLSDFSSEVAAYRAAGARTMAATLGVARLLAEIRGRFKDKKAFGVFVRYAATVAANASAAAPGDAATEEAVAVSDFLTSKNTPSEFLFLASVPGSLLDLMPADKMTPKAVAAWVAGMRSELAAKLVEGVKGDNSVEPLSEVLRSVADELTGAAMDGAARHLLTLHVNKWPTVGAMFDAAADGRIAPARNADKSPIVPALFGSEGSDELLKAVSVAFNGYRTEAEKTADKEAKARVAPLAVRDFASLSVSEVALHLFRILAGRVFEESAEALEASCADCDAIVAAVGAHVASVASGEKSLDDILNPKAETPDGESEAESDADVAA